MQVFFLGGWLTSAVIVVIRLNANDTPNAAMCVWLVVMFAAWAVTVLGERKQ